jgi:O-antigen/teichoic acid export membrane protein
LISWVLMPLFARAAAVSEAELCSMVRRSLELVLVLAIPVALLMGLGAEVWIGIVFGPAFAPAAMALRVLSSVFLLMYISIIFWCALTMMNRTWGLTAVFIGGLVVNPSLNFAFISPAIARFGGGGGGAACAMATLGTEVAVVAPMLYMLGRRVIDRRLVRVTATCLAICVAVVAIDRLSITTLGRARLILDGALYVVLVLAGRAVTIRDLKGWMRLARHKSEA